MLYHSPPPLPANSVNNIDILEKMKDFVCLYALGNIES